MNSKTAIKRLVCLLFAALVCIVAVAGNSLSLSQSSGVPGSEVSVSVSLTNTDSVSALQLTFPLGKYLHYVDGSCTLSSVRSNGHVLTASQVDEELRIYIYSLSLSSLRGGAGELLTFRLSLGKEPADYTLFPEAVLSNAAGANLTASVSAGLVSILAPKLQVLTSEVNFGHIPIRDTYLQPLSLQNVGNLPLTTTNISSDDTLFVSQTTSLTIAPQAIVDIPIEYRPTLRGQTSARLSILSDAINGVQHATIAADPFSVNELYVSSASGVADSIVSISLTMNNMEPIVAVQCAFLLPDELVYEKNSFSLCAARRDGHIALSSMHGDTLSLYIYSPTNKPLIANAGELATFRLRLNGNSNTYSLTPIDVVLSNAESENMLSAAFEGSVSIQSPQLYCADHIHFLDAPLTQTAHSALAIRNDGDAPLLIERATFMAEGYDVADTLPFRIMPGSEDSLAVVYYPKAEGDFSTTMNLYSNDPTARMKSIDIAGHIYEPNSLSVERIRQTDNQYAFAISLANYTPIVAVQFDIHWLGAMATSQAQCTLSQRLLQHHCSVSCIDDTTYRILIYSMANVPIEGNQGELLQLTFAPKKQEPIDFCNTAFIVDNIVLSNARGENRQSASSVIYPLQHAYNVIDTLVACDSYRWNGTTYTESGVYTDTLQTVYGCDSIVTLHLTINKGATSELSLTTCDSIVWNGKIYTQSGIYIDTLHTICGCDSIVTLHLTVNKSIIKDYYATACDSYFWDSNTAGYNETGDYTAIFQTVNGCDSIEILHLTINKIDTNEYYATACDRYTWLGKTYSISGNYTEFVETDKGCSYEILHLTIHKGKRTIVWGASACDEYIWNGQTYTETGIYTDTLVAANGCDSIVTLHLTIYKSEKNEYYATACDRYVWNGQTYTESGDYIQESTTAFGCNKRDILHLTINHSTYTDHSVTACDNYVWNGNTYTESGDYTDTLQTINGCDSIVVLHLTIKSVYSEFTIIACDNYVWNGNTYTESGDYTETFSTINGCDSIVTLHLTINNSILTEYSVTACDSYVWNGQTYTKSGDYTERLQTTNGCDSTIVLHLTINKSIYSEYSVTACDNYVWNGQTYTESGDYTETFSTINGCDSIVTLHLTINKSVYSEYSVTACDSYVWNGQIYTESGDYTETFSTINGCDSTVTLHLTINNSILTEYSVTACDSYEWNGQTYTESGDYTIESTTLDGCTQVDILHLMIYKSAVIDTTIYAQDSVWWNNVVFYESGVYTDTLQTVYGCDSIIHLQLIIDHIGTNNLYAYLNQYTVFPNPARDIVGIKGENIISIQIFSTTGVLMYEECTIPTQLHHVDIHNWVKGVYVIVIYNAKGSTDSIQFVKQE